MEFYSQHGEDKWIYDNLNVPEKGFFIDVGAGDPVVDSNTSFFDFIGWDGICIEPDERCKKEWEKSSRKATMHWGAVGAQHSVSNLHMRKRQSFSSLISNKEIMSMKTLSANKKLKKTHACLKASKVIVYTLDEIIDLYNVAKIDILSIDTEGTELDVMEGLTRINPGVIIVERRASGIKDEPQKYIEYFLKKKYVLVHDSGLNHIYIEMK